jgi:hypothetical protein
MTKKKKKRRVGQNTFAIEKKMFVALNDIDNVIKK